MLTRLSPAWRATALAAVVLVSFAGGATAQGKFDARNADKVDGKHAVAATASLAQRKGKLVATNPETGRLPNNIIGIAPRARKADTATNAGNAGAVGGVPADALKTLTFPITAAGTSGGATVFIDEADLGQGTDGTLSWTFVLPGDHDPVDDVVAEIIYQEDSTTACAWHVSTGGILQSDDSFANFAWFVPGTSAFEGDITIPAGSSRAFRAEFRLITVRQPGDLVTFTLSRQPGDPADNCAGIRLRGIQVRY